MKTPQLHGGNLFEAAEEFGLSAESFIDFSSNTNVFIEDIPSGAWVRWLSQVERYPDAEAKQVQQQISAIYQINEEKLLPTAGAIEALYLSARLFCGKKVAIIEPAFSDYHRSFECTDNEIKRVVLTPDEWSLSVTDLYKKCQSSDIVVLGNPNNPTGVLQSRKHLFEVLKKARDREQTWIIDEAFIEFVKGSDDESLIKDLDILPNLILIRSLTKCRRIPGLRLGFVCSSNKHWMKRLREMQPPWSVNSIAQAWARDFLTPKEHRHCVESLQSLPLLRKSFVTDLSSIPGIRIHPSSTNYFLIELSEKLNAAQVYRALGEKGILIRTCDSFFGIPAGKFIRVAVRRESENRLFAESLRKICMCKEEKVA